MTGLSVFTDAIHIIRPTLNYSNISLNDYLQIRINDLLFKIEIQFKITT